MSDRLEILGNLWLVYISLDHDCYVTNLYHCTSVKSGTTRDDTEVTLKWDDNWCRHVTCCVTQSGCMADTNVIAKKGHMPLLQPAFLAFAIHVKMLAV